MKAKMIFAAMLLLLVTAIPAVAQQDPKDPGAMDSVLLAITPPEAGANDTTMKVDLYYFVDEGTLIGPNSGFHWDNPDVQLDSVIVPQEIQDAYDQIFLFKGNDINLSNTDLAFQFGAFRFFKPGIQSSPTPRLIASYYFSVQNWAVNSVIHIDTTEVGGGVALKFVINYPPGSTDQVDYTPFWGGSMEIRDPNYVPVNHPPVLAPIGAKAVDEGVNLNFGVSATDSDGDPLTLTASPLPTGATFTDNGDGTGTFDWTPWFDQAGPYDVLFVATDGTDADSELVTITVNNVNRPPVLAAIGNKNTNEGVNLNFGVSASDPDSDSLTLTAAPLPTGATFTDNHDGTGTFDWTPGFDQSGSYDILFVVFDGVAADSELISIVVVNVNQPPVLDTIPPQTVNEGDNLNFTVSATDPDGAAPSLSSGTLPLGATFVDNDDGTGTFDWTPGFDQAGSYDVVFFASDGVFTDSMIVTITVNNVNRAPVLAAIGAKAVAEQANLNFGVSATDPDSDSLTLTAGPLPSGATFTDNSDGTGVFDWTPSVGQAGSYDVTFAASDGSLVDSEVVTITVTAGNALVVTPTELSVPASAANPFVPTEFFHVDASTTPVNFTVSTAASWLVLSDTTGITPDSVAVDFNLAGLAPGTYVDSIKVMAPDAVNSPQWVKVTLDLAPCPELRIDTAMAAMFNFQAFQNDTVSFADSVFITSIGDSLFFEGVESPYFVFDSLVILKTPSWFHFAYHRTFGAPGDFSDTLTVIAANEFCPSEVYVVVNVTVFPPPSADTVLVANVPAVPGATVAVPITFANSCTLEEATLALAFDDSIIHVDSVDFSGGVFADWSNAVDLSTPGVLGIGSTADGAAPVPPGSGNTWAMLYVTIPPLTPAGVYPLTLNEPAFQNPPPFAVQFFRDCGSGLELEVPEFIPGGLVVDTASNYICGWVVDPDGNSIGGATVELHADFPNSTAMQTMMTTSIGSFAFGDFTTIPFDLYAYADGYYPNNVQDLNFGDKGVKIVLQPLPTLTPTSQWVDYFCDVNTYFNAPLPVGSVVEARTPGNLLVGQFVVTEAGKYGFMPVYRANDQFGDEGARTGDIISFFINGEKALADGDVVYPADYAQVQVCLEAGAVVTKTCELMPGWNLVSWNVDTQSDAILDVLGPYMDCIDVVLGFEGGGLTYDPDLPEFSTLWYTDHFSGYWIKVKDNCPVTLDIEGVPVPVSTPIPVSTGWNLVSYLPESNLTPLDGFTSLDPNLLYAYGWNGSIQIYQPGAGSFNTLTDLAPCNGYWVKMSAEDTLVYPSGGGEAAPSLRPYTGNPQALAAKVAPGVETSPTWVNLYARNLKLNDETVAGSSNIEAYSVKSGRKVGQFTMTEDGKFGFMPVYASAEKNAALKPGDSFYLAVNGVETQERFTWTGNGDRIEITNLSAASLGGGNLPETYSLEQNYPNPFNPTTTISFSLPQAQRARVEIFNIIGELIAVPFDGEAPAGETTVVWDGRNQSGQTVASGVYFYRLTAGSFSETKKMMLLK